MKETYSHNLGPSSKLSINALDNEVDKEVADLYLPFCEEDDQHKVRGVSGIKPFAAFGSFRQRHGDALDHDNLRPIEAPAKLQSATCISRGGLSQAFTFRHNEGNGGDVDNLIVPSDCDQLAMPQTSKPHRKLYHRGKSFSTDLDREEAWERKKEQYLLEEEDELADGDEEYDADDLLDDDLCEKEPADESSCGSDDDGVLHEEAKDNEKRVEGDLDGFHVDTVHDDEANVSALHEDGLVNTNNRMPPRKKKIFTRRSIKPCRRTRTKSLTDDDMEELRGSIDLGFGFSYSERSNLKSTLPALELYYAINRNYVDAQSRSSPESPLNGSALSRTNSAGSTSSRSSEAWRISSPGDHPSHVKSRLRHWAQAVACSVKQGY